MTFFVYGPKAQFFDDNGVPLVGGQVWIYTANTNTPTNSYNNWDDAVNVTNPQTNPIILDARGECTIIVNSPIAIQLEEADVDPSTGHGSVVWNLSYFSAGAG